MQWGDVRVTREEVIVDDGVVAAGHPAEVEAGLQMFQAGGNAIDAAVSAAFAAGLVEPWNCGPGGHGFLAVHYRGAVEVIDWCPAAPRKARPDMWELEEGYEGVFGWRRVKDKANEVGYQATAIPGTVAGLCLAQERYGKLSLAKVLEPAIALAEEGFAVDWRTTYTLSTCLDELRRFPSAASIFLPGGRLPQAGSFYEPGDRLVQRDHGRTLRRITDEGPGVVYQGEIAQMIAEDMARKNGLITVEDLQDFQPLAYEGPVHTYRGFEYSTPNTPLFVEALNILEQFDLGSLGPDHPRYRHLVAEAMWQAFVDSFSYGDVPKKGLMSKEYAAELAARIDPQKARGTMEPGDPWKYEGQPQPPTGGTGTHRSTGMDKHTTQVAAVDGEGNLVSVHTSLGTHFGSYIVPPGTGMFLGNSLESFDPEPGKPRSIAPGKQGVRDIPTVLMFKDDEPFAGLSGSGGWRIIGGLMHLMLNLVDFGMGIQEAIEHPRLHCDDGNLYVDQRVGPTVLAELSSMGHQVAAVEENVFQSHFCRPVGVVVDAVSGKLHGGADPLRSAAVAGY